MKLFFMIFCVFMAVSGVAYADTDYVCLKQCVENGGNANICMPACTYGVATNPSASKNKSLSHGVFNSLKPVDNNSVLLKPKTPIGPQTSKDFPCFNQCLQQHNTYSLCEQKCVKTLNDTIKSGAGVAH